MYFDQWMTMKLTMNEKETIYTVVKITKQHKKPICLTVHICLDWQGKFFVLFWLLFIFTATSWCTGVNVTLFNRKYVKSTLMSGNGYLKNILLVHLHTNTTVIHVPQYIEYCKIHLNYYFHSLILSSYINHFVKIIHFW